MPQDKLQQLMLNRPVQVSGEVQYPKEGDPGVVDDGPLRFLGTMFGISEQKPGDPWSAAGALSTMLPVDRLISGLSKVGQLVKYLTPAEEATNAVMHMPRNNNLGVLSDLPNKTMDRLKEIRSDSAQLPTPTIYDNIRQWGRSDKYDYARALVDPNSKNQPILLSPEDIKQANTNSLLDDRKMEALSSAIEETTGPTPEKRFEDKLAGMMQPKQPNLPIGMPIVTHHPDVKPADAEAVAKAVRIMATRNINDGGRTAYNGLQEIYVDPNAGGAMHHGTKVMKVGMSPLKDRYLAEDTPTNIAAHEFQHAMDYMKDPKQFIDYPNLNKLDLGTRIRYITHPTEVSARAGGAVEDFLQNSEANKQRVIPPAYLKELALSLEKMWGDAKAQGMKIPQQINYILPDNTYQKKLPY